MNIIFSTQNKLFNYSGFYIFGLSVGIFNLLQLYFEFNKPLEIELPDKFNNLFQDDILYEDKILLPDENGNEYNL
jgi:hypothetical protein